MAARSKRMLSAWIAKCNLPTIGKICVLEGLSIFRAVLDKVSVLDAKAACPGSSLIQKLRLPVRSETYLFIPASQLRQTLTGGLALPSGEESRNCWPSARTL